MSVYLWGVAALALFTWALDVAAVWQTNRGERVKVKRRLMRWGVCQWVLVLAWCYSVIPAMLQVLEAGRPASLSLSEAISQTRLNATTGTLFSTSIIGLCVFTLMRSLREREGNRGAGLGWYLLPWFVLSVFGCLLSGAPLGRQIVLYPLIGLTFWLRRPPVTEMFRLFGWLTAGTAAVSLALGFLKPSAGLVAYVAGSEAVDKTIVGSGYLLAGVYTHPNELGVVLALGVPAVWLIRSRAARFAALGVVGYALLWSAARTSMVAAAVALLVVVWVSRRGKRGLPMLAVVTASFLIVWTPLTTQDPSAYSQRGQIWLGSLERWRDMVWFGGGPDFYHQQLNVYSQIGIYGAHGHNLVVNTLTTGGLFGMAAMAAYLLAAVHRASAAVRTAPVVVAYVVAALFVSWLEVIFDFRNLGAYGYAVWVPMAVVFFGAPRPGAGVEASAATAATEEFSLKSQFGQILRGDVQIVGAAVLHVDRQHQGRRAVKSPPTAS